MKLDFRHFPDGYVVTADDVEAELKRIRHALKPLEIVVVNTRAGSRYGSDDYVSAGCGMGYEATMYLLERGVRLTGTDAWSWDAPFVYTAEKYKETQRREPDLGRPQGRARHRLLPPGEAAQPGGAARRRLRGVLLPAQDPRRLGRLDARGGDLRRPSAGELPQGRELRRCHGEPGEGRWRTDFCRRSQAPRSGVVDGRGRPGVSRQADPHHRAVRRGQRRRQQLALLRRSRLQAPGDSRWWSKTARAAAASSPRWRSRTRPPTATRSCAAPIRRSR